MQLNLLPVWQGFQSSSSNCFIGEQTENFTNFHSSAIARKDKAMLEELCWIAAGGHKIYEQKYFQALSLQGNNRPVSFLFF